MVGMNICITSLAMLLLVDLLSISRDQDCGVFEVS